MCLYVLTDVLPKLTNDIMRSQLVNWQSIILTHWLFQVARTLVINYNSRLVLINFLRRRVKIEFCCCSIRRHCTPAAHRVLRLKNTVFSISASKR